MSFVLAHQTSQACMPERLSADPLTLSSLPPIRQQGPQRVSRSNSPFAYACTSPTANEENAITLSSQGLLAAGTADEQWSRRRVKSSSEADGLDGDATRGTSNLGHLDRPRTPRRRLGSYKDELTDEDTPVAAKHSACLPFVKCMVSKHVLFQICTAHWISCIIVLCSNSFEQIKPPMRILFQVNDKEMKALISTLSEKSTISRRALGDKARYVLHVYESALSTTMVILCNDFISCVLISLPRKYPFYCLKSLTSIEVMLQCEKQFAFLPFTGRPRIDLVSINT